AGLLHVLGELAKAEADARAALEALELHDLPMALPWLASTLGDILIERGRLDEAEAAVRLAPAEGRPVANMLLLTRARLWLALERPRDALVDLDEVRRRYAAESEGSHPWRTVGARVLAALGRTEEGLLVAHEAVLWARVWGAPRQLGQALRMAGLLEGGSEGLALLRESASLLESSPARLELAHALAALGAATR